jgi:hypothetical protein
VLLFILLISSLGCQPQANSIIPATTTPEARMTILDQREYVVHQQLSLVNDGPGQPEKQNIWIAMIRSLPPYQNVRSMEISPNVYKLVVDEYGNHYAEFDFSKQPAGTTQTVKIDYRVVVNELAYDLSTCQGVLPDDFIQPELHIESANPQIVALASELSQGKDTVCQQVRAFYDYIGNELVYTPNGANWGAQAALGPMGADCTEYSSLLIALSRAQRIPQDLAIVGFDNIPESAFFTPPLTTVHQNLSDVGYLAVDMLHKIIEANRKNESVRENLVKFIQPELVIRASSV